MFEFLQDMNNYEKRKVDCYKNNKLLVSTCQVSDGVQPFETAIRHPDYNDNDLIIVEAYETSEQATAGHARWVQTMITENLPAILHDCQNSAISQCLEDSDCIFKRNITE